MEAVHESARPFPLQGITVLDFGQIYQGPYATLLMALGGANVIKVEPPGGEPLRQREVLGLGASFNLGMMNSNKRAITLNLKHEEGRALLRGLVTKADILLENYAPGVMDRLGVGADLLRAINPRLIYASGSGYGLSGPDRDALAMDITVQAVGGIMSVTGFPDGPPVRVGPAIADFMGGIHLYSAAITALYEREKTGLGRVVEVAMLESVYHTMCSSLSLMHERGRDFPLRTGNRGGLAAAPYTLFECKDGHVAIFCVKEEHWHKLCDAMQRPELKTDPRFINSPARSLHLEETEAVVEAWTRQHGRDEVFAITREYRIPCAPVRDLPEVVDSPHMHERRMLQWVDHPDLGRVVLPGTPLRYHGTEPMDLQPNPHLGQHNHEVYGEMLGLRPEEVDRLHEQGAI